MKVTILGLIAAVLLNTTTIAYAEHLIPGTESFSQKLSMHGISFEISSTGKALHIVPSGLKKDNSLIKLTIDGVVTGADIGDINADKSPELYIYVKNKESTSLIAYSANKNTSLSEIYLPSFTENAKLAQGYRGHNEIALVENVVVQRFPVYRDGDSDDRPTGGTRQMQYKLKKGEASWQLTLSKTIEY